MAEVLMKLATLEAGSGAFDRAARLWGASERLLVEIGAAIPHIDQEHEESLVARAREELGAGGFAAIVAEGGAMGFEDVVDFVLEGSTAEERH